MKEKERSSLLRATNVADLLDDGVENGSDLRAEAREQARTTASTVALPKPSTHDPFAVEMAEADMAEKIEHASPRVRRWAWWLLAMPPLLIWAAVSVYMLSHLGRHPDNARYVGVRPLFDRMMDAVYPWQFILLGLIASMYWPYLLFRTRKRRQ